MHGFQHRKMGVAAGVGVLAYTVLSKASPEISLCVATLPIGAMLPDIDSDTSKLGRTRKKVLKTAKLLSVIVLVVSVLFSYHSGGALNAILNCIFIGAMVVLVNIIERNKHVKKQLGFITKHRGIMHTLIVPMFLMGTTLWTLDLYYYYSMLGLSAGCVLHLCGDMATEEGAPILWPITKHNIRYLPFNTTRSGGAIDAVCNIWCGLLVIGGVFFGVRGGGLF